MSLLDLAVNGDDKWKVWSARTKKPVAVPIKKYAWDTNYTVPADNTATPTAYSTGVNYPNMKKEVVINPWTKEEMFNKKVYGTNWENRLKDSYENTTSNYQNPYSPYNLSREGWLDVASMGLEAIPGVGDVADFANSTYELASKGDPTALLYSLLGLAIPFAGGTAIGKFIEKSNTRLPDFVHDFTDNIADWFRYSTNNFTKKGRFANEYSSLFDEHLKNRGFNDYFTKSAIYGDLLQTTLFNKYGDRVGEWGMGLNDKAISKIKKQDWATPDFPNNAVDAYDEIPVLTMSNTVHANLPPKSGLYSQEFMDKVKNNFGIRVGAGRGGQTTNALYKESDKLGSEDIWRNKWAQGKAYVPDNGANGFSKAISYAVLPPFLLRALQREKDDNTR